MYATLREELLNDKLLEGQPQDARNWLKEVSQLKSPEAIVSCCASLPLTHAPASRSNGLLE